MSIPERGVPTELPVYAGVTFGDHLNFQFRYGGKPPKFDYDDPLGQSAFVAFKLLGPMPDSNPECKQCGAWITNKSTEEEIDKAISGMALAMLKPYIMAEMKKVYDNAS